MYYISRFAVLGVFIFSFFCFSGWNFKGEVQRDIASVQPEPATWNYQGAPEHAEAPAWEYHAYGSDSHPTHTKHKVHYSPKYKM